MKEEHAIAQSILPANAVPFLKRIESILEENQTNNISSLSESEKDKVRACLWTLNIQAYGEFAKIDVSNECYILSEKVDKGEM